MNKVLYKFLVIAYAILCFYLAVKGMPAELAGFAVAGALSLVFLNLEAFAEFSGAGFSAKLKDDIKNLKKDIEPIKSKATEPENRDISIKNDDGSLSNESLQVLDALVESKYSWRTLYGLEKSTKLPRETLENVLTELEADELVTTSKSSTGKLLWGATTRGHVMHSVEHATYE